jgi:hypothetical protein
VSRSRRSDGIVRVRRVDARSGEALFDRAARPSR